MKTLFRTSALALAAAGMAVSAVPAEARDHGRHSYSQYQHRDRYGNDTRYYGRNYNSQSYYRGAQTWRGNDGRYYCRRDDGTTGLIVGGIAGGVLGNIVARERSRTLGTIIGASAGAIIGQSIDRGDVVCR